MGGKSGGSGETAEQKAINQMTLARLQKEEKQAVLAEKDRLRLLEAGQMGRSSLLTFGFLGPERMYQSRTARMPRVLENARKGYTIRKTNYDAAQAELNKPVYGGSWYTQGKMNKFPGGS